MNHKQLNASPKSQGINLPRLAERLDSIAQALGAARLGVARRLSRMGSSDRVFEVLAVAGDGGPHEDPARAISLEVLEETLRRGTPCAISRARGHASWNRQLDRWACDRIEGWPFPVDRLPSIFFVAHFATGPDPGGRRRSVARAGMDALARVLAPPAWAPLARRELQADRGAGIHSLREAVQRFESRMIEQALQEARGNKTEAARQLRMSRQGLYRKLHVLGLMDPADGCSDLDRDQSTA